MARSATVPTAGQTEADVLDERASAWQNRPLLRDIYHRYFAEMVAHFALPSPASPAHAGDPSLSSAFGLIVELGGGSGNFKEYFRQHHPGKGTLIATDIVPTPLVDLAADAMALPFADASVDNLLMMDVLHHLPYPLAFFAEARRVLRPGGRILLTEPYISPASRLVFKLAHPEPVDMHAAIFPATDADNDPPAFTGAGAFASNQAVPTLLFYRDRKRFMRRFPEFKLLVRRRRSLWVYPLSGGFSGPCLLPRFTWPAAWGIERLLQPLAGMMAFRLLMVLEKIR